MSKDADPPVSAPLVGEDEETPPFTNPTPDLPPLAAPQRVRVSPGGLQIAVEYTLPGYVSRTSVRWLTWAVQENGHIARVELCGAADVEDWTDWEQR